MRSIAEPSPIPRAAGTCDGAGSSDHRRPTPCSTYGRSGCSRSRTTPLNRTTVPGSASRAVTSAARSSGSPARQLTRTKGGRASRPVAAWISGSIGRPGWLGRFGRRQDRLVRGAGTVPDVAGLFTDTAGFAQVDSEHDGRCDPAVTGLDLCGPGCAARKPLRRGAACGRVDAIGLVGDDQIGRLDLANDQVSHEPVLRPGADRLQVDHREDGIEPDPGPAARVAGGLRRFRDSARLHHDALGRLVGTDLRVEGGAEIVRDAAAHAPVGQGDGVRVAPGDERRIEAERAEVVDQHRDPLAAGVGEEVVEERGLSGSEIAPDQRDRNSVGRGHVHRIARRRSRNAARSRGIRPRVRTARDAIALIGRETAVPRTPCPRPGCPSAHPPAPRTGPLPAP